ncbi:urokinase plasminogen activator surface receptor-like [Salvelinus fontinalis]|uniref:urokinase plasminogen activator surface receptor-like n=1 Tax=Salvelinus fontinalis TaxID=8038 RepID=UPI0024856DDA|nr:urokinase plasminogen activator surface receptor-like [Salvelinus fontinalis]
MFSLEQPVGYVKKPSLKDKVHCVVFVVDASKVSSYTNSRGNYGEATVLVNLGFLHIASNQLFCNIDGCNQQTLQPASSLLANGRQCPSCSSFKDTVCNSTVACLGVEDQCFSGITPGIINSTTVNLKGCTTSNVCISINQLLPSVNQLLPSVNQLLPSAISISDLGNVFTCETAPVTVTTAPVTVTKAPVIVTTAPVTATAWSIRLSLVLLLLGLTISKLI